eukprot:364825-Chlamydomonas_euryale.AAC.11
MQDEFNLTETWLYLQAITEVSEPIIGSNMKYVKLCCKRKLLQGCLLGKSSSFRGPDSYQGMNIEDHDTTPIATGQD